MWGPNICFKLVPQCQKKTKQKNKQKKTLGFLPNLNITWLEWESWEELECFWVIIK